MPSTNLRTLDPAQWQQWITTARSQIPTGTLPTYIPYLATVDPQAFALQVGDRQGIIYQAGDTGLTFSLMSVIKPFLLLYCLHHQGTVLVRSKVGDRPSSKAYNSLSQLQEDRGFPRNAMINSGAICLADNLPGQTATERCQTLANWLNQTAGCQLFLDPDLLASVRSLPNPRNQAIAALMGEKKTLQHPALALDTYNHICCLSGTINDLFRLGLILQSPSLPLTSETTRSVQKTLEHSGLYEMSQPFFQRTGLACKSGVSGVMLACLPTIPPGVMVCYSPPLNNQGHSVVGLSLLESFR
ncbi:MAG: glutaminase [Synechocystis sp.]|nr:glutaminase [Synechocystis sp.]